MKQCSRCKEEKTLDNFYTRKSGVKAGMSYPHCVACAAKDGAKRYQRRKETALVDVRRDHLRRRYGINEDQYEELLENQGGCCPICFKTPDKQKNRFAVDHDHVTGEIRGLLCTFCNHKFIGRARDSEMFLRAAHYLSKGTGLFVPDKYKNPKKRRRRVKKST